MAEKKHSADRPPPDVTNRLSGRGIITPEQIISDGLHIDPNDVEKTGVMGWCINVADRGFVWVGDTMRHGDDIYCTNALNVAEWGVPKGLGQLADTGPTKETVLHPVAVVIIPKRAMIAVIPAKVEPWMRWIRENIKAS